MHKAGNRLVAYLVIAALIVVGIGWYFSTFDEAACEDMGSEGCGADIAAIVVATVVLGLVMPCVVFFSERLARGPRRRAAPK